MPHRGNTLASLLDVKGPPLSTPVQPSNELLPSQLFPSRAALQPEKRLMLAVLEDAVQTFLRFVAEPGAQARRLFVETTAWFASDDTSSAFSFASICEALDLEPSYLRSGLRRYRLAHTRPAAAPDPRPMPEGADVPYHPTALQDPIGRLSIRFQDDRG